MSRTITLNTSSTLAEWIGRKTSFATTTRPGMKDNGRRQMMQRLQQLIASYASPAQTLRLDFRPNPRELLLGATQGQRFGVVVIDPPWPSRARLYPTLEAHTWSIEDIAKLPVNDLTTHEGFVFLWTGEGCPRQIAAARSMLASWGFKAMEDIVWLKTNRAAGNRERGPCRFERLTHGAPAQLRSTTEHCLVGVRGYDAMRNSDGLLNACVDTDVLVEEMPPPGDTSKPQELLARVERTCSSLRRLHLFGTDHGSVRPGWVTISPELLKPDTFGQLPKPADPASAQGPVADVLPRVAHGILPTRSRQKPPFPAAAAAAAAASTSRKRAADDPSSSLG
jgi:N6-adenosine-specific RNA methylase IME4